MDYLITRLTDRPELPCLACADQAAQGVVAVQVPDGAAAVFVRHLIQLSVPSVLVGVLVPI